MAGIVMINLQLMKGYPVSLIDAENMSGAVVVSSSSASVSGQVALLINKPDGTSAYLSNAQGAMAGVAATSNNWISLGCGELFRTINHAVEGLPGGFVRIQKSADNGLTWVDGVKVFESQSRTLYEYGGWYDAATDLGYVPCLTGLDGSDFSLVLYAYESHMTALRSVITLHDASASLWCRMTEGRITRLSSGTLVIPVYSSTDGFTAMDSPSGLFRCPAGADPSMATSWSYIEGSGSGTARGMIECQVVEMPNGEIFLEANTRSGKLMKQIWSDDGQTPGPSMPTEFVSPRTKADIIRLSCGGYAKVWCSVIPTGNHEGPRANATLAFSEDLVTWHDFHVVATGSFIYELYLQELDGKLRIRYWSWPVIADNSTNIAYDKWFDLGMRSNEDMSRIITSQLLGGCRAEIVAVLGPSASDTYFGLSITGNMLDKALMFIGDTAHYQPSSGGLFFVRLEGGEYASFDFFNKHWFDSSNINCLYGEI